MKKCHLILSTLPVFSFLSYKNKEAKEVLQFKPFSLANPEENSLMNRWENKPVADARLIDDKLRPYVAVISLVRDPDLQKEISGSFIKPVY